MFIAKTLSEIKQPKSAKGYLAPETDDLQYQSVFSTKDLLSTIKTDEAIRAPSEVKVRLKWQSNKPQIHNTATLQTGERIYRSVNIYNQPNIFASSVDFIFSGYARYVVNNESFLIESDSSIQLNLNEGERFYEFKFGMFADDIYETRLPLDDNAWLVIPRDRLDLTGVNHVIIRPCGGVCGDGMPISTMEQAYFSVMTDGANTQINYKRQSELAAMDVYPPTKRVIKKQAFMFAQSDIPRSPVQDIISCKLTLSVVVNDKIHKYRSIDYRDIDHLSNLIEITFVQ